MRSCCDELTAKWSALLYRDKASKGVLVMSDRLRKYCYDKMEAGDPKEVAAYHAAITHVRFNGVHTVGIVT